MDSSGVNNNSTKKHSQAPKLINEHCKHSTSNSKPNSNDNNNNERHEKRVMVGVNNSGHVHIN